MLRIAQDTLVQGCLIQPVANLPVQRFAEAFRVARMTSISPILAP